MAGDSRDPGHKAPSTSLSTLRKEHLTKGRKGHKENLKKNLNFVRLPWKIDDFVDEVGGKTEPQITQITQIF